MKRLLVFLLLFSGYLVPGQNLNYLASDLAGKPYLKYGQTAVLVKNLTTGKVLAAYNADKSVIPASVMKLFTTAAAINILTPDTSFSTILQYYGIVADSVLKGDLYVYGGGDPSLGSENFDSGKFWNSWVQAVKDLGIKSIQGNIIADAGIFDLYPTPAKWTWEDLGNYYGAAPTGLCIYDNTYKVYLKTGNIGSTARILKFEPDIPGLKMESYVKAAAIRSDKSYIFGAPFTFERIITGFLPYNRDSFVVKGAIPDPPLLVAQEFKKKLEEQGITVSGQAQTTRTCKDFVPAGERTSFFEYQSPDIADIVAKTNHKSINLYAEVLLNHLGFEKYGQGNTASGLRALEEFLSGAGIDLSGVYFVDGSGLSRYNTVTAQSLVDLLQYMYYSRYRDVFIESLPVAGKSGTLKYIGKNTVLENRMIAKSGSMKRVRAYAGYLFANNGDVLAFAVILNNFSCSQSKAKYLIQDFLIDVLKNN